MSQPQQIDRYEVRKVLGSGAMGSVYLAWDPKLHREVALKLVRNEVSQDPKWRERFQREARAVAALRQSNIVEIYDYSGADSEQLYIVMEKLEGDDLFNIVEERGLMPEPATAAVGHELCLALGVAHDNGIIHRDLKPENVFISPSGRVVLTDFGIVKAVAENQFVGGWDAQTEVIGTPGFMPPELMMNKDLGPHSDVFALGALLYNVVTGHLPYDGAGPVDIYRAMMAGNYEDPRKYSQMLSPEMCDVLRGMLEPKPKRRIQDVKEVREALKNVLAENGVTDLRDDLREYMQDHERYEAAWRRRAAGYLVERLKIATKDRSQEEVERIKVRLGAVDPDNDDVHAISGVYHLPSLTSGSGSLAAQVARKSGSRLAFVAGAFIALALVVGGVLWSRSPEPGEAGNGVADGQARAATADRVGSPRDIDEVTEAATNDDVPRPPEAAGMPEGTVTVYARGGGVTLYVDGVKIGKMRKMRQLELKAGKHQIEVRARRGRARKMVVVEEGTDLEVLAEVKRGKVTLR